MIFQLGQYISKSNAFTLCVNLITVFDIGTYLVSAVTHTRIVLDNIISPMVKNKTAPLESDHSYHNL